jgi:NTP pyrophosphatase (non-canonical NTP hydrolase)
MNNKQWTEHLYDVLMEEAAEVIQAVCKRKRFGQWSQNPDSHKTNQQSINDEINDFLAVVELLSRENERVHEDTLHQEKKMLKVRQYYDARGTYSNALNS